MSVPAVSGPFQMLTPYPAALPEMQPRTAAPPPAPLAGAAPAPGGANPPPATVHQPPASAAPLPQQEATAPPPAIITTPLPEPIARPAVTLRDERRTEHPAGAPRIRGVAAAATPKASVPPPAPPEPHDAAQNDDLTRVLTRLRTGEVGDDVVVDRLNTLSLAAARQGRPFRPRPTDGWPTPARSSREAHSATAASAIFTP